MRWIEVIRLRVLPGRRAMIVKELEAVLNNTAEAPDAPIEMKTYLNLYPTGDVALVLFWETDPLETESSRLALSLLDSLKSAGLVNHSVWVETSSPVGAAGRLFGTNYD